MRHGHCMKTVMGGLSLVLLLSACSSGAKSRKADTQARASSDVAADRSSGYDRGTSYDPTDRMTSATASSTERPVPSDRLGTGDRYAWDATPEDRIVPCADAAGDMTASMECDRLNRERADRMGLSDRSPEIAAACKSRTDAQGSVVFDDPACPNRYRRTVSDSVAAACASHRDAKGKLVYDDPACPSRHRRQMGSSYENVRWSQESAFYDRYTDKAVKHAREAEIAGNQGHVPEMLRHAELSLDQAKEAQRAGHHPDLDAGISALRDTILLGSGNQVPGATSSIREARVRLSRAAGMPVRDTRPANELARPMSQRGPQTIKGELARSERATGTTGGEHYVVRDSQNREMPISLSPEMSRQVQVGDVVEAQVDPNGQVTSITKTR
jgi:Small metal-binding protein